MRPFAKEWLVKSWHNLSTAQLLFGINPMRWDEIVGTVATKDYKEDELI